jgi:hypothetical protein
VLGWLGHKHDLLVDLVWASAVFRDAVENKYGKLKLDGSGNRPKTILSTLHDPSFWQGIGLDDGPTRLEQATKFTAICQWFNRSWIVQEVCLNCYVDRLGSLGTASSGWVLCLQLLGGKFQKFQACLRGCTEFPHWAIVYGNTISSELLLPNRSRLRLQLLR